ncbi:nuclear transport factor 2 family protein [Streptomyces sp. NPDC003717]|uniref:nuclear transport factor 2 family protein n=1 Tax=Streptomyces sp. NPDC003717 TaxID=3154276 RepID=UPI0033A5694E
MTTTTHHGVSAELYLEVTQFYAEHMQAADDGVAEVWQRGFAEDAVFETPVLPAPLRGRAEVIARLQQAQDDLRAKGIRRRHLMSMLIVTPDPESPEEQVRTRSTMTVVHTLSGEPPRIVRVGIWEDVLLRTPGTGWTIRHRRVLSDGEPSRS